MKQGSFLILITIMTVTCRAHTPMLDPDLQALSRLLKNVQTGSFQYKQTCKVLDSYLVAFEILQIDKKERRQETIHSFQLADISTSSINYNIEKDVITIHLATNKGEKLIKYSEDGSLKAFTNSFKFFAEDVENARQIVELLKKIIPNASQTYKLEKLPDTYEGLSLWLKTKLGNQAGGNKTYQQAFSFDITNPLLATFRQTQLEIKGGQKEFNYQFNFGVISEKEVKWEVEGDHFDILLPITLKQKLIKYQKDGKPTDNVKVLAISIKDVEQLKNTEAALRKLIKEANKRLEAQRPVFKDPVSAQKFIEKATSNLADNSLLIEQGIKANCICSLVRKTTDGKSRTDELFTFNLADLNGQDMKVTVDDRLFVMTLKTRNNAKYIQSDKNGLRQNYTSEVEIWSDDLERIRYLPQAFEKAIQACTEKASITKLSSESVQSVAKQIPAFKNDQAELKQQLTTTNTLCQLKFQIEYITPKKRTTTTYELNLKDLNTNLTALEVNGKNVFVNLQTNNKEKIIKTYEDDRPSDYTNTLRIQVDDIEVARAITKSFQNIINNCH